MTKTKIILNPKYEFLKTYIGLIPTKNENLGEVIYQARNTVFKATAQPADFDTQAGSCPSSPVELCIKSFKVPQIYNRFAYTFFRHGKALASYLNALRLEEEGFLTPDPVACILCFKGALLHRSYYVSLMVEGKEIRYWERIPDNKPILCGVASLMLELHHKGVFHRDFSPGNILYDEKLNFNILDINRMKFGIFSHHTQMQNFKRLNGSPLQTARLAAIYAGLQHQYPRQVIIHEAMQAFRSYRRERGRKRFFKNLIAPFRKRR
jgi:hypothetical protein